MDWLQFTASVLASFAWPAVLITLLIVLRKQIQSLAERMEEVTFPGGGSAKFKRHLEGAEQATQQLEAELPVERVEEVPLTPQTERQQYSWAELETDARLNMLKTIADIEPRAAVVAAFSMVEEIVAKLARSRGIQHRTVRQTVRSLAHSNLLPKEAEKIAIELSAARNTAAHAGSGGIATTDALTYIEQTRLFLNTIEEAIRKVPR